MKKILITLMIITGFVFGNPNHNKHHVYHPHRTIDKPHSVPHPAPRPAPRPIPPKKVIKRVVVHDCTCAHETKVKVCRYGSCVTYYNPQVILYDNEIELIVNGKTMIYNYMDYTVNMEE